MRVEFKAEAVNTLHYIPTGRYKIDKKTGRKVEVKQRITHRRLFLTALEGVKILGARNLRIVRVRRHGETTYSLSERKETARPWWEHAPPTVAKDYTRVVNNSNGRVEPPMTEEGVIRWLSGSLGGMDAARKAFNELEFGEPLEGDDRWDALERYGYERPVYEEEEEEVAAAA